MHAKEKRKKRKFLREKFEDWYRILVGVLVQDNQYVLLIVSYQLFLFVILVED
jgi:hypothetical protein